MASETLDIIIKGRNEAKQQLVGARDALGGIEKAAMGVMGALGLAFGGRELARAVGDLTMLGAQAQRLDRSFRQVAGSGADDMLERLRTASRGTITDMDLMLSANRAMMLGVTQSGDEMARLLELAAARGRAMGLSTQQAFDDIVTGLGRGSAQILDNLGIVIDSQAAYEAYARSIGKATDALTKQEQVQALTAQVVEQSQDLVAEASRQTASDAMEGIEQVRTAWENLKKEMGLTIAGGLVTPTGQNLIAEAADATAEYVRTQRTAKQIADEFGASLMKAYNAGRLSYWELQKITVQAGLLAVQMQYGAISATRYEVELARLSRQAGIFNEEAAEVEWQTMLASEAMAGLGDAAYGAAPGIEAATSALAGYLAMTRAMADPWSGQQVERFGPSYGGIAPWWRIEDPGDAIARTTREMEDAATAAGDYALGLMSTSEQVAELRRQQEEIGWKSAEWYRLQERIDDLLAPKTRGGGRSTAARAAEESARSIRSAIDAVFAPTQVTERDWWETNLGVYGDKPDEYLRRLRSAITDVNSEWKHLLGGREGDAARLFVAQQEELWRSGQWSQLGPGFDMGASKEAIVQGALAKMEAERARERMIADIMSDPRLGGFTVTERAQALGLPSEGASYAQALEVGITSVNVANSMTDAFTEHLRAESVRYRVLGVEIAGWVADGVEEGTVDMAARLARGLFPAMYDEMQRSGVVATP